MKNQSGQSTKFSIVCQSLYLANLLLLPGVFFLVLVVYYFKYLKIQKNTELNTHESNFKKKVVGIGKIHLYRSIQLSMIAGVMLAILPLIIVYFSNQFEASVMIVIFYFVTLHSAFVLIGMLNLSRAMAKKMPIF